MGEGIECFKGISSTKTKLYVTDIDSSPMKNYAADLGFISSQNILLVPRFWDNKVIAYKLSW